MLTAFDVANYYLKLADEDSGEKLSNMKLQKLLYYAQGFHLAVTGRPLFAEKIFAWIHGPVVAEVYYRYQDYGNSGIPAPSDDEIPVIDSETTDLLNDVYNVYGQFSAWKLRDLTHNEPPWQTADNNDVISHKAMADYFKTQIDG